MLLNDNILINELQSDSKIINKISEHNEESQKLIKE